MLQWHELWLRRKVNGHVWECKRCPIKGHRDLVGTPNMLPIGFGRRFARTAGITYLGPGALWRTESSSSLNTGQSCSAEFDAPNQRTSARVPRWTGQGAASPLEALSF